MVVWAPWMGVMVTILLKGFKTLPYHVSKRCLPSSVLITPENKRLTKVFDGGLQVLCARTRVEGEDVNPIVLDLPRETLGMHHVGQLGLVVGGHSIVALFKIDVVPLDLATLVSKARDNYNSMVVIF